jgi:hypothetical protein
LGLYTRFETAITDVAVSGRLKKSNKSSGSRSFFKPWLSTVFENKSTHVSQDDYSLSI